MTTSTIDSSIYTGYTTGYTSRFSASERELDPSEAMSPGMKARNPAMCAMTLHRKMKIHGVWTDHVNVVFCQLRSCSNCIEWKRREIKGDMESLVRGEEHTGWNYVLYSLGFQHPERMLRRLARLKTRVEGAEYHSGMRPVYYCIPTQVAGGPRETWLYLELGSTVTQEQVEEAMVGKRRGGEGTWSVVRAGSALTDAATLDGFQDQALQQQAGMWGKSGQISHTVLPKSRCEKEADDAAGQAWDEWRRGEGEGVEEEDGHLSQCRLLDIDSDARGGTQLTIAGTAEGQVDATSTTPAPPAYECIGNIVSHKSVAEYIKPLVALGWVPRWRNKCDVWLTWDEAALGKPPRG